MSVIGFVALVPIAVVAAEAAQAHRPTPPNDATRLDFAKDFLQKLDSQRR